MYVIVICSTHRVYDTKSDPQGSRGVWVMMTCQCRFINCHKFSQTPKILIQL